MSIEADVVTVLNACRMFYNVISPDELRWMSGLSPLRLWVAAKVISNTGLAKPPTKYGMVWPSNEAVLTSYRNQMTCQ